MWNKQLVTNSTGEKVKFDTNVWFVTNVSIKELQ
jgi:hypothetical protein